MFVQNIKKPKSNSHVYETCTNAGTSCVSGKRHSELFSLTLHAQAGKEMIDKIR